MDDERDRSLIEQAKTALDNAYAPYSGYRVGAAVGTGGGRTYIGANVENASYSATLCAERAAIAKAVNDGARDIEAVAIVSTDGREISPCGTCRQVIYEFNPKCRVITVGPGGALKSKTAQELLPGAFELKKEDH